MEVVVYTSVPRQEINSLVRSLPAILAGRAPDPHGIAAGFKARLAFAFLGLVKEAFEQKGRGQTGSDGITWPPLKQKTVVQKLAKGMTKRQLEQWKSDYRAAFREVSPHMNQEQAQAKAQEIATRQHEKRTGRQGASGTTQMLVDTGILRQSLSIGSLVEQGVSATYQPPNQEQFVEDKPGEIAIGTNVKYARYHHRGTKHIPARRFWPEKLPPSWIEAINRQARLGLEKIVSDLLTR